MSQLRLNKSSWLKECFNLVCRLVYLLAYRGGGSLYYEDLDSQSRARTRAIHNICFPQKQKTRIGKVIICKSARVAAHFSSTRERTDLRRPFHPRIPNSQGSISPYQLSPSMIIWLDCLLWENENLWIAWWPGNPNESAVKHKAELIELVVPPEQLQMHECDRKVGGWVGLDSK